jgi:hypothetical protein
MGIAPSEAKKMTVWEFVAVADRWIEAHDTEQPGSRLSQTDKDDIWAFMQKRTDIPVSRAAARRAKGNGAGH